RWRESAAGWLAAAPVAGARLLTVIVYLRLIGPPSSQRDFVAHFFDWIQVGSFQIAFDLRTDPLSILMALTITGVGTLIHLYAIDYMREDQRFSRFFGYMNLFVFFMLMLVLA